MLFVQINYAQKTDVVILKNGDHITGEVKILEVGILELKTDDMETVHIKWNKVESVQTDNIYEIALQDGKVYYGSIRPGDTEGTLLISGVTAEEKLFLDHIVKITRIRESFWDILGGYVRLGASFTKANGIGQVSLGFKGDYRTKDYYMDLTGNSVITTTKKETTSRKQDIFLSYRRYLEYKWFWGAVAGAEENTELGIQLRTSLGGGFGKFFFQTNTNWLNGLAGLTFNREWYADSIKAVNNMEGLIAGQHQLFIHDRPKVSLQTALNVYPGITDFGRVRADLNIDLDWEIIIDLYWSLTFYFNFDSRPKSNASQTDYRFDTSFKYEL